jgi:methylated-DNA-[protein]-cysteine S-methyltransferase
MPQLSFHTPLGALTLSEEDGAIVALDWGFGRDQEPTSLLREGQDQLQAYFDGALKKFDLPLAPSGTPYQRRVWEALLAIPYGSTCSYGAMAARIGGSPRAVGGANGANPIPIVIPCHRVVGSAGLGGYSGGDGLETKRWLIALERDSVVLNQHLPPWPALCFGEHVDPASDRIRPDHAPAKIQQDRPPVSEER